MSMFEINLPVNARTWCQDPIDGDRLHPDIQDWITEFCPGGWHWYRSDYHSTPVLRFFFDHEEEAVAFKLRWY